MKLVYKDEHDIELGSTVNTGIREALIPAFSSSHDIYITISFDSRPGINIWHITNLEYKEGYAVATLEEAEEITSLATYITSQTQRSVKKYLQKYSIVEVDFGFFSQNFNCEEGKFEKNLFNSSSILPGELHKKRPCIVLAVDDNRVQVMPLSTSSRATADKNNLEIDPSSFDNFAIRYKEKPSYALCGMIQTVSIHRVYPPRNDYGKHEHKYSRFKLCSVDQEKLNAVLAREHSKDIVTKLDRSSHKIVSLNAERAKLLEMNSRIKEDNANLTQMCALMEKELLDIGHYFGVGETLTQIRECFSQAILKSED
ncbi:hypothetical protein C9940_00510 [Pseudidiomarina aestuarii]|uniref:Uncharacterized protein n=1 Tax=Pseudidiomarina aestuarii TaxID=624146 RepID=A0A2T4CZE6_9GAMM|nr:hypothetical protein C9940_00510 [Pseudidiomarina aestuarii]